MGIVETEENKLFHLEHKNHVVVIYVDTNQINMYNIPEMEMALAPVLGDNPKSVIMDLTNVSYLDSSAMGAIFRINKSLVDKGGNFFITGVNSTISMVLKITRSDSLLKIFKTVQDAIVHA